MPDHLCPFCGSNAEPVEPDWYVSLADAESDVVECADCGEADPRSEFEA